MLSNNNILLFFFLAISIACQDIPKLDSQKSMSPEINQNSDSLQLQLLNYILGRFDPGVDKDFVEVKSIHADREGLLLRKEAYSAFVDMFDHASKDGFHLIIRSATRNFDYQKSIWEKKWSGETILSSGENAFLAFPSDSLRAKKILEYSSMPGSSRHHWGTDIDLNSFDNAWFESGVGLELFNWLETNAATYGFCRPYTKKGPSRPEGYNEEKWHWSYLPLSQNLTKFAQLHLKNDMLSGFEGSQSANQINIVDNYVLGIDPSCFNSNN